MLAVEVRQCLVLMEKNGSICKTGAQETVWQLDSEIHSGDFSEDTIPSDSSLNGNKEIYTTVLTWQKKIDNKILDKHDRDDKIY